MADGDSRINRGVIDDLEIRSQRGFVLRASLHRPSIRAAGALIVCHGMLSSRQSPKHVAVCERAAKHGWAALRFDFAGRGQSQGEPADLTVSGEVEDLRGVLAEVRSRGFARPVLVGSSLGGTVAILTAASDREIGALVTVAAPAALPERPRAAWGADSAVTEAFFTDAKRHDVLAAARLVACPWLVIHGEADEVVSSSNAHKLCRANSKTELVLRPGADHRFSRLEDRDWLVRAIVGALP